MMTRLEENRIAGEKMVESAKHNPAKTNSDIVAFELCVIAAMLTDISKSLAILADKVEREDQVKYTPSREDKE